MREQKGRLGNYVRNARATDYPTLTAWSRHLNISERTLGDLERGNGAGPNTIAAVENALGWAPGSARDILNGGEPTLLDRPDPEPEPPSYEELTQMADSLARQVEELQEMLRRRSESA